MRFLFFMACFLWANNSINAQCVNYNVYASDSLGCQNDILKFKVHPKPPAGSILNWDFGFKKVNNDNEPAIAFTSIDTFSVAVDLIISPTLTCSLNRSDYIKIGTKPTVQSVSSRPSVLCNIGEKATITVKANSVKNYVWSIEDTVYNTTSDSIVHTFKKAGFLDLQLVSNGVFGCSEKRVFDSVIFVERKPIVSFPFQDSNLCGASNIRYKPSFQYFGQSKYQHNWRFFGAKPALSSGVILPNLLYFQDSSNYEVRLRLLSQVTSCKHEYNFDSLVKITSIPKVEMRATPVAGKGCKSKTFGIRVLTTNLDSSKLSFFHLSGDSLTIERVNKDSIVIRSKYPGNFKVYANYQFSSCTKVLVSQIEFEEDDVKANFELPFSCVCTVPSSYNFKNTSTHSGGLGLKHNWTLSKNNWQTQITSKDTTFRWTFDKFGKYSLTLKVEDENGCTNELSREFEAKPLAIDITTSKSNACVGSEIELKLTDTICYDEIDTVAWTIENINASFSKTIKTTTVNQSFKDSGWYSVSATVKTKKGCIDKVVHDSFFRISTLSSISVDVPNKNYCAGDFVKLKYWANPKEIEGLWLGYLIHQDTSLISSSNDSLKFQLPFAGVYDLAVVFKSDGCQDSFFLDKAINVGGLNFDFSPSNTIGCLPFSTTLNSKIKNNLLVGSGDTTLRFKWELIPENIGTFNSDTLKNPELKIIDTGNVDIKLTVTNSLGCSATVSHKGLFDFNLASSFQMPDSFCESIMVPVINTSKGFIDSFRWSSTSAGFSALPSYNVKAPQLMFKKTGWHSVTLTVFGKGGCDVSYTDSIKIIGFNLGFSVDDTSTKCSPAPFNFTAYAKNVDSFIWYFDDGAKPLVTNKNSVFKIYDLVRINPLKNRFNVKLIGKNQMGCIDSAFLKSPLKVEGPIPRFSIKKNKGCSPFTAEFIDQSVNVSKVYFDFGNQTSIDSVNTKFHTYNLLDSTSVFEVFKPFVIVKDENECQYSYNLSDSIVVYRMPKAKFAVSQKSGCDGEKFSFFDRSTNANKWHWFFDKHDSLKNARPSVEKQLSHGKYEPSLVVENIIGCTDTFTYIDITVHENPTVNFNISDSFTCIGQEVYFKDSTVSSVPIAVLKWNFGDTTTTKDTSNAQSPSYTYSHTSDFSISLIAIDNNGCSDTLYKQKAISIKDTLNVEKPNIKVVSIINQNSVEIEVVPAQKSIFKQYKIVNNNGVNQTLVSSKKRNDSSFTVLGINTGLKPLSFTLELIDKCDYRHLSDSHVSVFLNIDSTNRESAQLKWTKYKGWDTISSFQILRSEKGGVPELVAVLPSNQVSYQDSLICNRYYNYKVLAVNYSNEPLLSSASNTVAYKPNYDLEKSPLTTHLGTVNHRNEIEISWHKSKQRKLKYYTIDRRSHLTAWHQNWAQTKDTFYIDSLARTDEKFYKYRIRGVDACEYSSNSSSLLNSILLNAINENKIVDLNWNAYCGWPNGVANYIIERKGINEARFNVIAITNEFDTSFVDTSAYLNYKDVFCYRICAIEKSTKPDSSFSNTIVVNPAITFYVPNAFTPNGDGKNDVFETKSFTHLQPNGEDDEFELRIYNRWGQKVFETFDHNVFWNGNFKGQNCQEGKYTYYLQFKAINNKVYSYSGTVLLIR
ncbi:MAG: gliding motility-associated C-terminal domain-containing protein [Bacteroidia bacterium]